MAAQRPPTPDSRAAIDLVRELGALLTELGLSEIEVSVGELRVRVGARRAEAIVAGSPSLPTESGAPAPASTGVTIEAPMVGTFYRASSPTAEPYVREGDVVKEGQILCIIEAMKLMNEIETRAAGRVVKIFVDNGQPVEYGQPLFLLEPSR